MHSHLQRLLHLVTSATQGMDAAALTYRAGGKWNAAEVLEHLFLTYAGTVKGLERCLEEGRPAVRNRTLKDQVSTLIVTGLGYFPEGRQAPERTIPRGMPTDGLVKALEAKLANMDDLITRCEIRFGRSVRILDHPVLGPLTANQWRRFHLAHARHHVKQILRLRAMNQDPNHGHSLNQESG